ncbi:uncharacterized protein LOC133708213 [Rosa rugosa]|uniref:uncharacterized protein LOC133708213 n=1 Tax=Rosa rugosa TaxID=74645 RepID=UPI002B4136FA|nr:uncharacterized protein LOC133708213 [Rosa rugosa]
MTIEDLENEATLIVMGKAAEQLFGNSCQELMNRRQYPTRQTLPKEIEDTIGQHHLFQIEPRSNSELIVKAIFPDPEDPVGVATPDRSTSEKKKRTVETSKKALFIGEPEKKSKRESRHERTTSPSPGTEEDQTKKK